MRKLILITLSIFTLMFSSARSVRAQVAIAFPGADLTTETSEATTPEMTPSETVEVVETKPEPASQPIAKSNRASVINFNVATNTKKRVRPTLKVTPSVAVSDPPAERTSVEVVQSRDRLVAMSPDDMFEGGSNSLVAKTVGHAEGTRTALGEKTWAYYGHTDPGNGVWNRGSFSYQHEADSPEDADVRQLNRLRRQYEVIEQAAIANGLQLNLQEQLNGIDLANQAPLAALDRGGYVDRLRQARAQGLRGSEAVLQARTYSFINPNTNRWDAPGLGNTEESISRDQARRLNAIEAAMSAWRNSKGRATYQLSSRQN